MLINLFSIFDPSSSFWSSSILWVLSPLAGAFLINNSKASIIINIFISNINTEIFQTLGNNSGNSATIYFFSWFILVIWYNISGLIPFSFTLTAQILICIPLALSIWMSTVTKQWANETSNSIAHLVPGGAPAPLMPLLVIIELISSLIRPITLSVRLTANIVAGHLIISLLAEGIALNNSPITIVTLLTLSVLETAVAAIQAYVFTILLTIYETEI